MPLWVDEAERLAGAEVWELVGTSPGPYQCDLSRGWIPEHSRAVRIRGRQSGTRLVVGQGVARKYFGVRLNRAGELIDH